MCPGLWATLDEVGSLLLSDAWLITQCEESIGNIFYHRHSGRKSFSRQVYDMLNKDFFFEVGQFP
jgi:hypothetical protein